MPSVKHFVIQSKNESPNNMYVLSRLREPNMELWKFFEVRSNRVSY